MSNQQGGKPPGPPPPYPAPPYPPQQPQQQQAPGQPYPYPPQQQQQPYPPQPYPYPPQPYPPQAPQPYPPQAQPPYPYPPPPQAPPSDAMFGKSLGRAFRLRIEPNEVTPSEHAALTHASPPITDPHLMAFLSWRRSVLFLVALALVPLTALRLYDTFKDGIPDELRFLFLIPAAAEGALCIVCWYQLKNWMHWRRQRRTLFRVWLIFMAAPFLVFLVPMDGLVADIARRTGDPTASAVWKVTIAVMALLTLAPKAVSLLAGTIRAAIVTKMLFPGTAGPGWLIVLATPLYTLFVFTLLIIPYHATGNGLFLGAMLSLAVAQISLARAGYALAKPTTHDDAVQRVTRARVLYLLAMLAFGGCLLGALGTYAKHLGTTTIVTTILSFETNVLILTLIGSDLLITNLERARGNSSGTAHLADDSNKRLSSFVGES